MFCYHALFPSKSSFESELLWYLTVWRSVVLEKLFVTQHLPYEITVSAIYCPPRYHNIKQQDFLDYFQTLGPKYTIRGEFNCKHPLWGSRLTTTRGRELAKAIHATNCFPSSTGTPTYWPADPGKVPDLLDFYITYGISKSYMEIEPNYDLSSVHTPVIVTLSTTVITAPKTLKLHNAKTNWQTCRNTRIQLNISLKTPEEVDVGIDELTTTLQEAARQATPSPRTNNITFDIKNIILEKRNVRKKWHRSHSPLDKTLFNQLSTRLKKKLKETQNTSFFNVVSSLNRYDKLSGDQSKRLQNHLRKILPFVNTHTFSRTLGTQQSRES